MKRVWEEERGRREGKGGGCGLERQAEAKVAWQKSTKGYLKSLA